MGQNFTCRNLLCLLENLSCMGSYSSNGGSSWYIILYRTQLGQIKDLVIISAISETHWYNNSDWDWRQLRVSSLDNLGARQALLWEQQWVLDWSIKVQLHVSVWRARCCLRQVLHRTSVSYVSLLQYIYIPFAQILLNPLDFSYKLHCCAVILPLSPLTV